jgi:YVTN family beta-propeller protein
MRSSAIEFTRKAFLPSRLALPLALTLSVTGLSPGMAANFNKTPTRSTSIALTGDGKQLVNVNHDANSVTVFKVQGGSNLSKLAEIPVGREPVCVAVHPRSGRTFVTNSDSGTVSVIDLKKLKVIGEIAVGTEPEGCAITPSGQLLYVANHTSGTVSVINTGSRSVIDTVVLGGNPTAIAISNDGRDADRNERVFVTQFYAELIPGGPGEGFDNGKRGVVFSFPVGNHAAISKITLSPLPDTGFPADRSKFCNNTTDPDPVNQTFCPDPAALPGDLKITQDIQQVFPNQLWAAVIRDGVLYVPNIGAQPEPPVFFNANVQALVHVVDTAALVERSDLHVNLNAQIKSEVSPANPIGNLGKLFGNDVVAMDCNFAGSDCLIVSRGGNYVLRASASNASPLNINAPNVVRFKTGNLPSGIVISANGQRAFVNNELDLSVSVLALDSNSVLANVPSSTPPEPGSFEHSKQLGKLVFFTALGTPDNGLVGIPVRNIDPLQFRGKQSDNAWSSCGSCHPRGLSDGVTWIFPDGPRNTLPLDGLYSKLNGAHDTRINNWSAARDSVTDFNNNSRAVQCGAGFAGGDPLTSCNPASPGGLPNPAIFDHGVQQGGSEALDFETTWAQTVRALNMPKPAGSVLAGAATFDTQCASCHGGAKWTKSQVLYLSNPALKKQFAAGDTPRDPGLTIVANQMVSYRDALVDTGTLNFLENVGTFNPASPIEIRGAGGAIGQGSLGAAGFNVPSLLGTGYHAPYFHDGSAPTLDDVFARHQLAGGTIASVLAAELPNLKAFLLSIDGRTPVFISDGDIFKDPTRNLP